METVNYKNFDL